MPQTAVLQGRWKVHYGKLLGEGGFSKVFAALDLETNTKVAVKLYKARPGDQNWDFSFTHFLDTIKTMDALCKPLPEQALGSPQAAASSRSSVRRDSFTRKSITSDVELVQKTSTVIKEREKLAAEIEERLDVRKVFVQILGHSQHDGVPGLDGATEQLFIVFELGGESLEERLLAVAEQGGTLSVDELRQIQWSLISVVCCLHAAGYVHLDIKPANIIRFGDSWKLIDFDGAVRTGTVLTSKDLCLTPCYMPPEAARAWLLSGDNQFQVSRIMDVWSVGMCAIEAVFLQPVLGVWYHQWREETGSDDKFLRWLGLPNKEILDEEMCEALTQIDPDMCDLLKGMLTRDKEQRFDIAQCLVHPWFKPIRDKIWKGMALDATSSPHRSTSSRTSDPTRVPSSEDEEQCPSSPPSKSPAKPMHKTQSGISIHKQMQYFSHCSLCTTQRFEAVRVSRACTVM